MAASPKLEIVTRGRHACLVQTVPPNRRTPEIVFELRRNAKTEPTPSKIVWEWRSGRHYTETLGNDYDSILQASFSHAARGKWRGVALSKQRARCVSARRGSVRKDPAERGGQGSRNRNSAGILL